MKTSCHSLVCGIMQAWYFLEARKVIASYNVRSPFMKEQLFLGALALSKTKQTSMHYDLYYFILGLFGT